MSGCVGYTPGPWTARKHGVIVGGPAYQYVNGETQSQVAMACVLQKSEAADPGAERDANAALIAAAPALVEALKIARDYITTELEAERRNFKGHEYASNIADIERDLAQTDAALRAAGVATFGGLEETP